MNFYAIKEVPKEEETQEIEFEGEVNASKSFVVKGNYLFTSCKTGLMVIHHRRAVERITYDRMMTSFVSSPISSQKLLFPFEKEISAGEKVEWINNSKMLERVGFETIFDGNTLNIHAIPAVLQEENINQCLDTILESISFKDIEKGDVAHVLIQSIARSASLKKNIILNNETSEALISDLFQCAEHSFTPNGKTILKTISMEELTNTF